MSNISFSSSVGKPLSIEKDQVVNLDTILAHTTRSEGFRLQLADELGIPHDKIFLHLTKIVGDTVETNEIIATKKSTFGSKQIAAPKKGIIKEIDHESGSVIIETATETADAIPGWFVGVVEDYQDETIKLKVADQHPLPAKDVTQDFGGTVLLATQEGLKDLTEEEVNNAVIFVPTLHVSDLVRLDVLGARGVVTQMNIREKENVASAQLQNPDDWGVVSEKKFSHCLVDKKNSTMYLYTPVV